MITDKGQGILAKYLVGQAPSYASYIAIGCGAKPVPLNHVFSNEENEAIKNKESLDFEMFRVPITSRGYVNENNINKIVFTAELPTLERYEITEVGVFSAGSNPSAGSNDSRTIFSFSSEENWQYHGAEQTVAIESYEGTLDTGLNNIINKTDVVFQTNADNPIFTTPKREARRERCRFLNNMVALRGDMSAISILSDGKLKIDTVSKHIHLTGASLDFDKVSPKDDLRLAFSLINKDGESIIQPEEIRIMLEFGQGDDHGVGQYARFETVIKESDSGVDFATGRYFVSVKKFEELVKSTGFTWNVVDTVKFYASVINSTALVSNKSATSTAVTLTTSTNHSFSVGNKIIVAGLGNSERFDGTFEITEVTSNTIKYNKAGVVVSSTAVSPTVQIASLSDNYYVCLDALRLENTTSLNPLYGLTGYSIIKNTGSKPIAKLPNTTNHIEFRFGLDVV